VRPCPVQVDVGGLVPEPTLYLMALACGVMLIKLRAGHLCLLKQCTSQHCCPSFGQLPIDHLLPKERLSLASAKPGSLKAGSIQKRLGTFDGWDAVPTAPFCWKCQKPASQMEKRGRET